MAQGAERVVDRERAWPRALRRHGLSAAPSAKPPPQRHWSLEPKGPKRLHLRLEAGWRCTFFFDDVEIGVFVDRAAARVGADFALPDGRALTVRSERSILFDDCALAVDGVAVPGSLHDVDTAVARVSSWVRWAVGSRLFYVLLDWRDGVSRPLWIELLAPALAAAGGLLLWRRRQSALPVLIASAVAWVLTGASTWFSFVWAAWFIAIAVRARAVLRDAAPVELRQLGGATTAMAVPTMTSTPSAAVGRSSDAG